MSHELISLPQRGLIREDLERFDEILGGTYYPQQGEGRGPEEEYLRDSGSLEDPETILKRLILAEKIFHGSQCTYASYADFMDSLPPYRPLEMEKDSWEERIERIKKDMAEKFDERDSIVKALARGEEVDTEVQIDFIMRYAGLLSSWLDRARGGAHITPLLKERYRTFLQKRLEQGDEGLGKGYEFPLEGLVLSNSLAPNESVELVTSRIIKQTQRVYASIRYAGVLWGPAAHKALDEIEEGEQ